MGTVYCIYIPVNHGDERCDQRGRAGRRGDIGEYALRKTFGIPSRGRS